MAKNKGIFFNDVFLLKEQSAKFMAGDAWSKLPTLKHKQEEILEGFRAELRGIYNDYKKFETGETEMNPQNLNASTDRLKKMTQDFHNFLIDYELKQEKVFCEFLEKLELVVNHYQGSVAMLPLYLSEKY